MSQPDHSTPPPAPRVEGMHTDLKNKLVALKKWAEPPAAQTVAEPQPAVRSN